MEIAKLDKVRKALGRLDMRDAAIGETKATEARVGAAGAGETVTTHGPNKCSRVGGSHTRLQQPLVGEHLTGRDVES